MAKEGNKAPAFTLAGDDGKNHKLSDYKGKKVVLYFYQKTTPRGAPPRPATFATT